MSWPRKKFKIGDIQRAEAEDERRQEEEKLKRAEMFKSFAKHGQCPDYKPEECDCKSGVYICWDSDKHRKYRCPVMRYEE